MALAQSQPPRHCGQGPQPCAGSVAKLGTTLCVSCRSFFAIDLVYLLLYLLHAIDDAPHTRDCGENSKGHTTLFVYADEWNVCDLQQEIRAGGRSSL